MDKYKADLEYLFKALIKHPMFIREPEKLNEFKEFYKQMLSETDEDNFDDFVMMATAMTVYFKDGHTTLKYPTQRMIFVFFFHVTGKIHTRTVS